MPDIEAKLDVATQIESAHTTDDDYLDNLHEEIDSRAIGGSLENLPKGYYRSPTVVGTFVACALACMCAYATYILPVNVITIINADLGPSPHYVWISLVWTLACTVVYAVGGRLSDILGRRWFFIVGNGLGTIGAIIASRAKDIDMLIGANTLIGIAAGVQQMWPMAIDELVPNKYRGYINVLMWACGLPFSVFSPVIARSLIAYTSAGWRGCYYIATGITATATVLFYLFYHPPTFELLHKGKSKTFRAAFEMVDIGGTVLLAGGLVVFLMGISWGGQQYPWKSGQVIGCIIGGFVILTIFVFWELYYPQPYPLLPMRLLKNGPYMALIFSGGFLTLTFYNLSILWPMQAQIIYASSVVNIGWLTCATGGGTLLGDIIGGSLIQPLRGHKWQMVFYSCCGTAFCAALAAVTPNTKSMAVAFVLLSGMSVGAIEAVVYTLGLLSCHVEDIGLAMGIMNCVRAGLSTISTAIYITVLTNKLGTNVPKYVVPAATRAGLPASEIPQLIQGLTTGSFAGIPNITSDIIEIATTAYKEAYTQTFKIIYLATIPLGVAAIGFAFFCPNMEDKLTNFVGRRLHGKDITALAEKDGGDQGETELDDK